MTEKKTFKNVRKSYMDSKECLDSWYVEADGKCGYFKFDEWDMEVTFTRKMKEIKVGDTVTDDYYSMRVVAIEGDQAWCYNYINSGGRAENFYSTEWLKDLKHAD